ncbi:MAG: hypothetical protein WCK04_03370 [Actinomycetes bacterium]
MNYRLAGLRKTLTADQYSACKNANLQSLCEIPALDANGNRIGGWACIRTLINKGGQNWMLG